jgi:hypothetical protein
LLTNFQDGLTRSACGESASAITLPQPLR